MTETNEAKWVWMAHPAHFIGANDCQFRLATYVNGFIISSVGEYKPMFSNKPDWQEIGWGRTYETMVFKARKATGENECAACLYVVSDFSNIDMEGYDSAKAAYAGHIAMCEKYSKEQPHD